MNKTDRKKAQQLLQEVLVVLSDVNEIEKTLSRIKNQTTELYTKLNNTANGEDQR